MTSSTCALPSSATVALTHIDVIRSGATTAATTVVAIPTTTAITARTTIPTTRLRRVPLRGPSTPHPPQSAPATGASARRGTPPLAPPRQKKNQFPPPPPPTPP